MVVFERGICFDIRRRYPVMRDSSCFKILCIMSGDTDVAQPLRKYMAQVYWTLCEAGQCYCCGLDGYCPGASGRHMAAHGKDR